MHVMVLLSCPSPSFPIKVQLVNLRSRIVRQVRLPIALLNISMQSFVNNLHPQKLNFRPTRDLRVFSDSLSSLTPSLLIDVQPSKFSDNFSRISHFLIDSLRNLIPESLIPSDSFRVSTLRFIDCMIAMLLNPSSVTKRAPSSLIFNIVNGLLFLYLH